MLNSLQQALQNGHHATGFSYELGAKMLGVESAPSDWPLAHILLFDHCQRLDSAGVARWLAGKDAVSDLGGDLASGAPSDALAGVANLQANVDESGFDAAIRKIRAYIEAGDTYQVNYTYRLRADVFGSPVVLSSPARAAGGAVRRTDGAARWPIRAVLFAGIISAARKRETDGTSHERHGAREWCPGSDAQRARMLSEDEKNRAENLMIVDLLRNDLGRIAQSGSVHVPALYGVNAFGGVLQMTSTITANLRNDVSLLDLFTAVYPCGPSPARRKNARWKSFVKWSQRHAACTPARLAGLICQNRHRWCAKFLPVRSDSHTGAECAGRGRYFAGESWAWGRALCSTVRHKKSMRNAS